MVYANSPISVLLPPLMTPSPLLKAFHVDEGMVYAALDAFQASVLYEQDTGLACDEPDYPKELSEAELDAPITEMDADDRPTGGTTSLRAWLERADRPGLIACNG